MCRSRELICKKSIKRLKANCKFGISRKTINYESPPFKDIHIQYINSRGEFKGKC